MFSWIGDSKAAREITIRASKRFKIKVIEGGYKTRQFIMKVARNEYGMVRKGDRVIGQIEFESNRITGDKWQVTKEQRK
jgi:cell division protein FtsB